MQDPVVLRGLLQCIAIGLFFSGRYLLDVLFTPHVVQTVPQQVLALAHRLYRAAWCAPAMSLVLLHYWGSLEYGFFSVLARWLLRFCILRSLVVKLMDDEMVVWHLRKVHIWVLGVLLLPPVGWSSPAGVAFQDVGAKRPKSGREAPVGARSAQARARSARPRPREAAGRGGSPP